MRQHTPKLLPGWLVVLLTILALGAALCVFAFFHHVLPSAGGQPIKHIAPPTPSVPTPAAISATPAPSVTPQPNVGDVPEPEPEPTPTPVPEPAPVGDFSAAFSAVEPMAIDGEIVYTHMSDQVKLNVYRMQRGGSVCYIADIWIRNIQNLQTAFAKDTFGRNFSAHVTDMAKENGALVAISGDYYGTRSRSLVIRNGDVYRDAVSGDVCVLYWDGVMRTYSEKEFSLDEAIDAGAYQAWDFGPALLADGSAISSFRSSIKTENPRCAIGYYEPGHYCFVVVDGRQHGYSSGMTLAQLSLLFSDLGCASAYNLDGGQSAIMASSEGLISQPAGGGRKISDIIFIKEIG